MSPEIRYQPHLRHEVLRFGTCPRLAPLGSHRQPTVLELARAATGLAGRGFTKGERLALYSPNVPEYAVAFYAVASLSVAS